jgi:GH15 family glucan-1,4-alpha-glucosidase
MRKRIEDYALIGDRQSAALICRDGSIDWLCWPRFDSDACFAALLGGEQHGRWLLAPRVAGSKSTRRYRPDTLTLETRHIVASGRVLVVDLMPIGTRHRAIIRQVVGEAGEVDMVLDLNVRFDYGRVPPWLRVTPRMATAVVGPDLVILRSEVDLKCEDQRTTASFRVHAGQTFNFVLQYGRSFEPVPAPIDVADCIAETEHCWVEWVQPAAGRSMWPQAVKRSLITLQALVHPASGGIVAAPTMGLPEIAGGRANWDYRYCWLRDSTLALEAFLNAGFRREAQIWRDWLLRAVAGDPAHMQTMYRCDGARHIETYEIPWLPGYEGARPVRVGNAALKQVQLDIYGEVLDLLYVSEQASIEQDRPREIQVEQAIVDHIESIWERPDRGIWESQGPPRHFTYSKVMAWVGVDRFLKLSAGRSVSAARRHELETLRDNIHARICRDGFDTSSGNFVKSFGSDEIDASLLRLPQVGFLPISDARITRTIDAAERILGEDGLIRRSQRNSDGPDEGAFLICTCWLANCRAMQGRMREARAYFERLLGLRNDVGLLAEEWDVGPGRLMGNFPQALSHLALVNTALRLSQDCDGSQTPT